MRIGKVTQFTGIPSCLASVLVMNFLSRSIPSSVPSIFIVSVLTGSFMSLSFILIHRIVEQYHAEFLTVDFLTVREHHEVI